MVLQQEFEREGNWLFRYRSYLPIIMLVLGLAVFVVSLLRGHGGSVVLMDHWHAWQLVCLLVSLAGLGVRVFTVGHTPEGTSGRNTRQQLAESLNTTGIYSQLRHPLYLGNFLMYLGIAMLTCKAGFVLLFCLVYWLYYERIMYCEEQFLQRKFGERYLSWASHTPAFVPRCRRYVSSADGFSWKKTLKKEKNGVFALLLIFSVFDAFACWLHPWMAINKPLLVATLVSGVAYLVLKVIKKRTTWLDEPHR